MASAAGAFGATSQFRSRARRPVTVAAPPRLPATGFCTAPQHQASIRHQSGRLAHPADIRAASVLTSGRAGASSRKSKSSSFILVSRTRRRARSTRRQDRASECCPCPPSQSKRCAPRSISYMLSALKHMAVPHWGRCKQLRRRANEAQRVWVATRALRRPSGIRKYAKVPMPRSARYSSQINRHIALVQLCVFARLRI